MVGEPIPVDDLVAEFREGNLSQPELYERIASRVESRLLMLKKNMEIMEEEASKDLIYSHQQFEHLHGHQLSLNVKSHGLSNSQRINSRGESLLDDSWLRKPFPRKERFWNFGFAASAFLDSLYTPSSCQSF